MQKTMLLESKPRAYRSSPAMGRVMKLIIALISIYALQTGAAQAQVVTLSKTNAKLVDIFKEIRKQTGYDFVYTSSQISEARPVTINLRSATLEAALAACFRDQPLAYSIKNKVIIVKTKVNTESRSTAFSAPPKYRMVTGRVTGTDNKPLAGVTVASKELNVRTFTDQNGTYRIDVVDQGTATLVFTHIGFETREAAVAGMSVMDVTMTRAVKEMNEIVVTGYQVLKKSDVVGSVASVQAKDLNLNGINTLEQALQGKLAGVVVTNSSGMVGTRQNVRVRGTSTLVGTQEPIWVVDGIIQEDPLPFRAQELNNAGGINADNFDYLRNFVGNSIRWLNPNDIQDITVLKDASATAIYGVRAANGVIVITTKKGQVGPPSINYSTNLSVTDRVNYDRLNLMNSKERVAISREIYDRGLTSPTVSNNIGYAGALNDYLYLKTISESEFKARVAAMETVNTDWFDLLFRTPFSMSHNLGISGGNANTRYYSSFGYNTTAGTAIGNDIRNITGNLSMNSQLSKNLSLGLRLSASKNTTDGFYQISPYDYATKANRAIAAYDANGQLSYYRNASGYLFNILNERNETGNTNNVLTTNAVMDVNYQISKNFRFQTLFSYNASATNGATYATDKTEYVARALRFSDFPLKPNDPNYILSKLPQGGEYNQLNSTNRTWGWRNNLSYSETFAKKHNVAVMVGVETNSTQYDGFQSTSYGYLRDRGKSFATLPLTYTTAKTVNPLLVSIPTITDRRVNTMGVYLTSSYTFDSRYVLNFSVRNDRSNRFGQFTNEKFNPVWAGGLRWNIANEKWFVTNDWLSGLSLRSSIGYQRNIASNVSPDLIIKIPTGVTSNSTESFTGEQLLTVASLPYGDLRWEQNLTLNLGLDWSLFQNRISGTLEYYNKRGRELITSLSVPLEYGTSSMLVNGGSMSNSGYELTVNFVPVRTRNFTWSVNFNTSKNNNRITKTGAQVVSWQTAASGQLNVLGRPVSGFYAFRSKGIDPKTGEPIIDLSTTPGSDPKDPTSFMQYVGKLDPDLVSGLGMNFRYKMLTLSSSFYLQLGGKRFLAPLYNYAGTSSGLPTEYENLSRLILDRWSPSNPNATVPALPNGTLANVDLPNGDQRANRNVYNFYNYSTDRVVSASSLRCNNLNLSYSLPANVVSKLKCKNIALGGGVSNVFSINSSDFKGIDPEVATGGQPRTRTYTFSMNLSF
ncbi:SusC/RagA family TonB-linked outer membrane protein [Mucilaginibacter daejeonensis]|uniref:SusC/RagA family TonB-linked outer membrane protein n=1 Tax=Mucilaginibacter daejeonensis TaxID=398049 RepID=UPI001D17263D|nr:SusC/RagA family TonB-linked outer membrane protein [Mucilaginibacter daejeonensis]UEG53089.1 SusC/RagA family TonB-linked outer membrane protein [Mucilaginibacter daejeonensis]